MRTGKGSLVNGRPGMTTGVAQVPTTGGGGGGGNGGGGVGGGGGDGGGLRWVKRVKQQASQLREV